MARATEKRVEPHDREAEGDDPEDAEDDAGGRKARPGHSREKHRERGRGDEHSSPVGPGPAPPDGDEKEEPDCDRAHHSRERRRRERWREEQRAHLVRDAEEAPASIRVRPDRCECVDVGPDRQGQEEEREEADNGR